MRFLPSPLLGDVAQLDRAHKVYRFFNLCGAFIKELKCSRRALTSEAYILAKWLRRLTKDRVFTGSTPVCEQRLS